MAEQLLAQVTGGRLLVSITVETDNTWNSVKLRIENWRMIGQTHEGAEVQ